MDPSKEGIGAARSTPRFGPYRVVRELARGGMGAVFEVVDERSDARYALKTILGSGHGEDRLRFKREVEALGRLDHPHVVRVHAAELASNPPYLVQELLSGGSLHDRLRNGPLPWDEVVSIGVKLCDALARCHAQDVLHRDLKPSNVMLDERGEPKLVDFGLVRSLADDRSRLTETGELLGTPGYLAPEQARAEGRIDARTDVYGLCATLFALLSGRPPFAGRGLAGLAAVVNDPPPSLTGTGSLVPPWLAAVIERGLAKAPDQRFSDATALADALESSTREPAPSTHRPGLLVVLGLAVLGGLGVWSLSHLTRTHSTPSEPTSTSTPSPVARASAPPTPGPDGAWKTALVTARKYVRAGGVANVISASAALNELKGDVPDRAERASLRDALADAVRRLLPSRQNAAFAGAVVHELVMLLRVAERLPQRPVLPPKLWERTWRTALRLRLGKKTGFVPWDAELHGLLADLDPTNIELQERVLNNSDMMGSKGRFLKAARRAAAHPYDDPARRLLAQVRLAMVLGHTNANWTKEMRLEALATADALLPEIARAKAEGWPEPARFSLPTTTGRTWLETCTGQVHMARGRALMDLNREEEALPALRIAGRYSADPVIPTLRVVAADRLGRVEQALQEAQRFLAGVGTYSHAHGTVIGVLWRIYVEHARGLPLLRENLARLLGMRSRSKPLRWVCLVWLDHVAGDAPKRDERLETALHHIQDILTNPDWLWARSTFLDAQTQLGEIRALLKAKDRRGEKQLKLLALRCGKNWW